MIVFACGKHVLPRRSAPAASGCLSKRKRNKGGNLKKFLGELPALKTGDMKCGRALPVGEPKLNADRSTTCSAGERAT